ncbi:MAG: (d)CMP kinase [Spirochaetales bacterium]|nr:(d)CMP kinase [Spirochaetales bacterium]
MIVALDGPAGVGKSTIVGMISERMGFFNLNSGRFYRGITYKALKEGVKIDDPEGLTRIAESIDFTVTDGTLMIDGIPAGKHLHSDMVDKSVAQVSAIVPVRHIVNKHLRRIGGSIDVIVEGRDITTVVFPDAECKIYLDASIEARAKRRFNQGTSNQTLEELFESIRTRDEIDKNKIEGSLQIAQDAIYFDTSDLTISEVCETLVDKINRRK